MSELSTKDQRRAVLAGTVGTIIEWYDYGIYGLASAVVFGHLFFSTLDPQTAVLASLATFGVGFAARPLGGLVLGHLGDKLGRKSVLLICVVMIGVATVLIGMLPTFQQIGIWAPIFLVILRFIQGFGAGVELAAAVTVVAESVKPKRRGTLTSVAFSGQFIGGILGSAMFLVVTMSMSADDFIAWGWRIPFLFAFVSLIFAIVVRLGVKETPEFEKTRATRAPDAKAPLVEAWTHSRRNLLAAFLIPVGQLVCTYIIGVFVVSYVVNSFGMAPTLAATYGLITAAVTALLIPVVGAAVDRFGPRKVLFFGVAFNILAAFPAFALLSLQSEIVVIAVGVVMTAIGSTTLLVPQGSYTPSLFPTSHRLAGFAGSRELATAIFAGPTPFIASALLIAAAGAPWLVAAFLAAAQLFTAAGLMIARARTPEQIAAEAADAPAADGEALVAEARP